MTNKAVQPLQGHRAVHVEASRFLVRIKLAEKNREASHVFYRRESLLDLLTQTVVKHVDRHTGGVREERTLRKFLGGSTVPVKHLQRILT